MNSFSFYGVRVLILLLSTSLLLVCVSAGPAFAEESSLKLHTLVEEALLRNPDIQAARRRWESSQAIIPQVQSLPDPSLLLGYQRMPMLEPLEGPVYGFSQKFPFPGKLGNNRVGRALTRPILPHHRTYSSQPGTDTLPERTRFSIALSFHGSGRFGSRPSRHWECSFVPKIWHG